MHIHTSWDVLHTKSSNKRCQPSFPSWKSQLTPLVLCFHVPYSHSCTCLCSAFLPRKHQLLIPHKLIIPQGKKITQFHSDPFTEFWFPFYVLVTCNHWVTTRAHSALLLQIFKPPFLRNYSSPKGKKLTNFFLVHSLNFGHAFVGGYRQAISWYP
jgi:hypothetical protein